VKLEVVLENSAIDKHKNVMMGKPERMLDCIQEFRHLFIYDFHVRCGFTVYNHDDQRMENTKKLPAEVAMAALLNPLYGGKFQVSCDVCFFGN
jgi:hypothetical protein